MYVVAHGLVNATCCDHHHRHHRHSLVHLLV